MIWLLTRIVVWPTKLVTGTAKVGLKTSAEGFRAGYKVGNLLGYRRMVVLGVGVGIGLLVAPVPGRELREKLQRWMEGMRGRGGDDRPASSTTFASPSFGSSATSPSARPSVPASSPSGTTSASSATASPTKPATPVTSADNPPSTAGAGAGDGGAEGSAAAVQDTAGTGTTT